MKIKFCYLITFVFLLITAGTGAAGTITVDDSGGADYALIREAVDNATAGDTILVYPGTYPECVLVDKQLTIKSASENPHDVIIKATNSSDHIFHVTSINTSIIGFSLVGYKEYDSRSGIYLDNVRYCLVQNNIISGAEDGILLGLSSENKIENNILYSNRLHGINVTNSKINLVIDNRVSDNKYGIYLNSSDHNTISNNNASLNENYGIALLKSNESILIDNIALNNKYGICLTSSFENEVKNNIADQNKLHGTLLWYSEFNCFENNSLSYNGNYGSYFLGSCDNNKFNNNNISNNNNGMYLYGCENNLISNNIINSNNEYGIFLSHSENNIVQENVLLNNKKGIETRNTPKKQISFNKIDDRFSYQQLINAFFILIVIGIAFYLKQKSLLKKTLIGVFIAIILAIVAILAWYFPFESGLPGNNVYIEDIETNITPINETFSRVTLSMNLNYLNKDSFLHTNKGDMTDDLPVLVQVKSSSPVDGTYTDKTADLEYEENIILQYLETNPYECTFDLKSGTDYYLSINVLLKEELDYPHPYYGELKWDGLGGLLIEVDLK